MMKTLIGVLKVGSFLWLFTGLLAGQAAAGTLRGTVQFSGEKPAARTVDMNADPHCKRLHTKPVLSEEVTVSAEGGLKNVFVYIKEGLEGQVFEAPAAPVLLDQKGCLYEPRVFGLRTGQTLEILNSDATLHNVHGMPTLSREFNLGMPIQGMKLKRRFDSPEVMVKLKCDVHPWMAAYAGVLSHPFFSVSSEDGSFLIDGLPAGSYGVEAWHETYGTKAESVVLEEDGDLQVQFTYGG